MNRLNLGSGLQVAEGWVNLDRDDHGQEHRCDMRDGLPFETGTVDACVAHHVLDMLTLDELAKVLGEVHRVLVPGGVLRISTPDVERAIDQYRSGASDAFPMVSLGQTPLEKLCHYLTWYGTRKTLLCFEMLAPMLLIAGFREGGGTRAGESIWNPGALAWELDSRPDESLFVEAIA